MRLFKKKTRSNIFLCTFIILCALLFQAQAFTVTGNESITVTAIVPDTHTPSPGAGSGGTILLPPEQSGVGFSGYAYPYAIVTLLKNTVFVVSTRADENGFFSISTAEPYNSTHIYTLYADDLNQERSLLLNYPLVISLGKFTQISNIIFAPTLITDKVEGQNTDTLIIEGYGMPQKTISITIKQGARVQKMYEVVTNTTGKYSVTISLDSFASGTYTLSASYVGQNRISKLISLFVGKKTTPRDVVTERLPGNCSLERKITLTDFSILAYWYGRANPPECIDTNKDGIINLVDFSILAYYWTG